MFYADRADRDHGAPLASTLDGQFHRLVRGGRRGDENGIGAITTGETPHFENRIVIADGAAIASQPQCQVEVTGSDVQSNNAAAAGLSTTELLRGRPALSR